MGKFKFESTPISDMFIVTNFFSGDERGSFSKIFNEDEFYFSPMPQFEIKETLVSISQKGVIRGLHFQLPYQAKLVSCIKGEIWDVGVDLRKNSPTYGQYYGTILSEVNHKSLFIPKGFAHGYSSIKDSIVIYQCDEIFNAQTDGGINYLDPTIKVNWVLPNNKTLSDVIVSNKDNHLPFLQVI